MIRYALRDNLTGHYRSARWRRDFKPWGDAQLWENPKSADKALKEHQDVIERFSYQERDMQVVSVIIQEPS